MKKIFFLKLILSIIILSLIYVIIKSPPERKYEINTIKVIKLDYLVDDFNKKLNPLFWNIIEKGNNYNNELQYYNHGNININNSILEIVAHKEDYKEHHFTSGMINTKDKFEFLYGKIIFRAKPAIEKGLVSAIWLLPADGSLLPEIDIIEILGNKYNQTWTGIHYLNSNSELDKNFVNYKVNDDFNIYQLDWEENEIRCYVNNKIIYKTNVGIPNKKMYLIINLAVGGDWAKNPKDNFSLANFLIDYIMIIPKELDSV